jgi:ABC-type xylose transport system permease subunit
MTRKRYIFLQAGVDFAAFNIVSWASAIVFPNIGDVYGEGLLSRIWPLLISGILVVILALFRQYRIRQRDRFWRQSMGAFNAVTLGFLIIVIISFDLGVMLTSQRGHLFFLLLGLLIATALSRVITYLSMGRRPDFSFKEPMVLKNGNGSDHPQSTPLVLAV